MEIKATARQASTILSKEITQIEIRGVSKDDAKALTHALHNIYGVHAGQSAKIEIIISGKTSLCEGTQPQNIATVERWESQEDCNHFLKGYELAMLLNGIDIHKEHLEWF